MSSETTRRRFLGAGTVIATGRAGGAFTRESLAADPKEKPADLFVKRADKRLLQSRSIALERGRSTRDGRRPKVAGPGS